MRTGTLVAAVTASGVVGGLVGAFLAQEAFAPPPAQRPALPAAGDAPARDPTLEKEVASLRARLDELQASAGAAAQDATRLRTELEKEGRAAAEARARIEGLEASAARPGRGALQAPALETALLSRGTLRASAVAALEGGELPERMKKAQELRKMTEDERWAAIRDALGLAGSQEDDLKAALKDRNQQMQDAVKALTDGAAADGTSGRTFRISGSDLDSLKEARKKYDDRIGAVLTADQAKKWREDGYEDAAGGGTTTVVTTGSIRIGGGGEGGK